MIHLKQWIWLQVLKWICKNTDVYFALKTLEFPDSWTWLYWVNLLVDVKCCCWQLWLFVGVAQMHVLSLIFLPCSYFVTCVVLVCIELYVCVKWNHLCVKKLETKQQDEAIKTCAITNTHGVPKIPLFNFGQI